MSSKVEDFIDFNSPEAINRPTVVKCDFDGWLEVNVFSPFQEKHTINLEKELPTTRLDTGYDTLEDLNEKFSKLRLMDTSTHNESFKTSGAENYTDETSEATNTLPEIQITNISPNKSIMNNNEGSSAHLIDYNNGSAFSSQNIQNVAFCAGSTFNFTQNLNTSFESGKESLGILPEGCIEESGRESLGILHLNFDLCKLMSEETRIVDKIFETGSSMLSISPSFNFGSKSDMSEISKISAVDQRPPSAANLFNIAFTSSTKFIEQLSEEWNGLPQKCSTKYRPQIKSLQLPAVEENENVPERKAKSLGGEEEKIEEKSGNNFNDSVFIEATHIAAKIKDGSIYEDDDDLNSTTPPSLEVLDETDQPETKCDTDTVFKKIDQLMPASNKTTPETSKNNTYNLGKSEETEAILHNLSAILDKECTDPSVKQQGKSLISSLADIMIKSRCSFTCDSRSMEDSGRSSIECDMDEQPLDLRVQKSGKPIKSQFSQSLINGSGSSKMEVGKMSESLKHQDDNTKMKFKLKKAGEKSGTSKSGPLKAVIPITNMTKTAALKKPSGIPATPPKVKEPPKCKSRKTSTPIRETKMKPMAASTPDSETDSKFRYNASLSVNKKKFDSPSPQEKQKSFTNLKPQRTLNRSTSVPQPTLGRRKSAGDLQATVKPARRNSLGKEGKMSAALSKVRQTIANSKLLQKSNSLAGGLNDTGNKGERLGLKENRLVYGGMLRAKKGIAGKENAGH